MAQTTDYPSPGWEKALKKLRVRLVDSGALRASFRECRLRSELLKLEKPAKLNPYDKSMGAVSLRYRYDVLCQEVASLPNQAAAAVYWASLEKNSLTRRRSGDAESEADRRFWFHLDAGAALVLSGWERLALLLDLAFNTGLGSGCGLAVVLQAIKEREGVAAHQGYKELKSALEQDLGEFDSKYGKLEGLEEVQTVMPSARYCFDLLELDIDSALETSQMSPEKWLKLLARQQRLFADGVASALGLISDLTPIAKKCPHCEGEILEY